MIFFPWMSCGGVVFTPSNPPGQTIRWRYDTPVWNRTPLSPTASWREARSSAASAVEICPAEKSSISESAPSFFSATTLQRTATSSGPREIPMEAASSGERPV